MSPITIESPDLKSLAEGELRRMAKAGEAMIRAQRQLSKAGHTLVERMLGGADTMEPWTHYPPEDVYDYETASQYYYHSHGEDETGSQEDSAIERSNEHGHFHLFLRDQAFPLQVTPRREQDRDEGAIAHLVAISMDRMGRPLALFTTNGWVTSEDFYPAEDLVRAAARFGLDHTQPCLAVNQWLTASTNFFAPQIAALLRARDDAMAPLAANTGWDQVLEDRAIEVVSRLPVSPEAQMREILALLPPA